MVIVLEPRTGSRQWALWTQLGSVRFESSFIRAAVFFLEGFSLVTCGRDHPKHSPAQTGLFLRLVRLCAAQPRSQPTLSEMASESEEAQWASLRTHRMPLA